MKRPMDERDEDAAATDAGRFFAVSPLMLFPEVRADFRVYLRQRDRFVLYTKESQAFTEELRRRLHDLGTTQVFVPALQKEAFAAYLEENLGRILGSESIAPEDRARIFRDASTGILRDVFSEKLPESLGEEAYARVERLVRESLAFLSSARTFRSLVTLVAHTYRTYTHSVNVLAYTVQMMAGSGLPEKALLPVGVGALLHDLGKARLPRSLLDKRMPRTPDEESRYRQHPLAGVAMCANLRLPAEAIHSILFHHERADGGGYPSGLSGAGIPPYVRVLTVADAYDNLTAERSRRPGMSPFEALTHMRERSAGAYDPDAFKRLVLVLSGANLV